MRKMLLFFLLLCFAAPAYAGVNTSIDAVRDTQVMLASFTTTTTVETSATFQVSANAGALTTAAATYTVTAGKTFKLQSLTAACRGGGTPAASTATLRFKANGIQQGQAYQVACPTTTTASAANFPSLPITFGDNGIDYRSGTVLSFTITLTAWGASTPILDLGVYGYEY